MRKTMVLLTAAMLGMTACGHASDAPTAKAEASDANGNQNVVYATVNGTPLHLDVFGAAASGSNRPAIVLIHGGTWRSLDKSTMQGMAQFLARHGFVAFTVDYRLYQEDKNGWPAQLDDVQRAVRWVRANAERYGVNPDRIGAYGHSSGGQLASLLGMQDTRDNSDPALAKFSSRVQAVVDVDGPTDFTKDHSSEGSAFLTHFLGATYEQKPELWQEASPVFRVARGDAPFLIVHGTQDENVPMAQAQELLDKLQAAGVPATLVKINDSHTFKTPEGRHELALQTLAFFNRYLVAP